MAAIPEAVWFLETNNPTAAASDSNASKKYIFFNQQY